MSEQPPLIVGVDTQALIWAVRNPPEDAQDNMHERATWLIEYLERIHAQIVFPTVALHEFLVKVDHNKHAAVIAALNKRFQLLPFDLRAASEAAKNYMPNVDLKDSGEDNARNKFKADLMIVATVRIAGATDFYSHDGGCRKLAERMGMTAHNLPVRPIIAQPAQEQQSDWEW